MLLKRLFKEKEGGAKGHVFGFLLLILIIIVFLVLYLIMPGITGLSVMGLFNYIFNSFNIY